MVLSRLKTFVKQTGRYANPSFVKLTRYEAIGYVYVLPIILLLGLTKNIVLFHAFRHIRIRSHLARLLKLLLISDLILWILLVFYPLVSSVGTYTGARFAGTYSWNFFVLYILQPALHTFYIFNIHLVTLMAANQYLMYAFPKVYQVWRAKKYILKYVLVVDFFIVASMEYTMLKWVEVTKYNQYGSQPDIYYYDVVKNPTDNYVSYEVTNNLILVIAPLILLIFLSLSNLRYFLKRKFEAGGSHNGAGDLLPSTGTAKVIPGIAESHAMESTNPHHAPNEANRAGDGIKQGSGAEEKLLSILTITLSFQYLVCNIPIAVIQVLYPKYECYPGLCDFRFYVLIASMLQLLNPNLDFYIFYGLKSLRRAVGTLWSSTVRDRTAAHHYDSSSSSEDIIGHGSKPANARKAGKPKPGHNDLADD